MKDVLVFSIEKFEEFVRANYNEKDAERVIECSKEWTEECEGLTPEQMKERGYVSDNAWLVKKSEQGGKKHYINKHKHN